MAQDQLAEILQTSKDQGFMRYYLSQIRCGFFLPKQNNLL